MCKGESVVESFYGLFFFLRRLTSNPSYYDPSLMIQDMASQRHSSSSSSSNRRAAIAAFVDSAVCTALDELLAAEALRLRMPTPEEIEAKEREKEQEEMLMMKGKDRSIREEGSLLEPILESTPLGRIACMNYISPRTAKKLSDALKPQQEEVDDESLSGLVGGHSYERKSRGRYLTFVDLVRLLSDVEEFKQMPVR